MSKSRSFEVISTGVIYREQTGPQGYYARVLKLLDSELVGSFVASREMETSDIHPMISRSTDSGRTWQLQGPVDPEWFADPIPSCSETGFISHGLNGELLCLSGRWEIDPANPEAPLVDPVSLGMRRNTMVLRRSNDSGRTWSQPVRIPHGVDAPLEIPTGVLALGNGDLIISFSTWPEVAGESPFGHRICCIRSSDNGKTWTKPSIMFYDPSGKTGYWEARIAELPSGKLMATCWANDLAADEDIANGLVLSSDGGATWSAPMQMPVMGQTGWPVSLGGDLVLFAYNHRRNPVGVRGMIGKLTDTGCELLFDAPIFEPQVKTVGAISQGNYAVVDFQFGAPSLVSLGGNRYMAVYWCVVGGRSGINYTILETE